MKNIRKYAFVLALCLFTILGAARVEAWWSYENVISPKQPIKPIGGEYYCSYPSDGWMCQDVRYGATGYQFQIRYNLVSGAPTDHVIFGTTGYLAELSRYIEGAKELQDKMAAQNVRSYDILLTKYDIKNPIPKAPNSSVIVASLAEYISDKYVGGKKVKMVLYDYSTTLASYALAYHKLENDVNELIFLGGPAGFNYKHELYDGGHPSYLTAAERKIEVQKLTIIDGINWVNGWEDIPDCGGLYPGESSFGDADSGWFWSYTFYCEEEAELNSASMFSDSYSVMDGFWYGFSSFPYYHNDVPLHGADLNYPGVELHVIHGGNDAAWFKKSSKYWLDHITAKAKTTDTFAGVDHDLYASSDVTLKILDYLGLKDVNLEALGKIVDTTAPTKATVVKLVDLTVVPGDTLPPSVGVSPAGATDDTALSYYEVYRDGVYVGDAYPGVEFKDYGVVSGTAYEYTVKAVDASGNVSPISALYKITTAGVPPVGGPAADPALNDKPAIQYAPAYQLESGAAFDKDDFWMTCLDNQDGEIKGSLVVTFVNPMPAVPAVGDTYPIKLDCTDSDGNIADQKSSDIIIIAAGGVPPPPLPPPPPAATTTTLDDLGWLYGTTTSYASSGPATPGGLVPCGDKGQPTCEFCHTVSLLDNVTQWLVKILTILATIIFVVSGVRMATSVGDVQVKQASKKLIINTATGLVIVLGAWIFIDLLLQSLLVSTFNATLPWYTISCS